MRHLQANSNRKVANFTHIGDDLTSGKGEGTATLIAGEQTLCIALQPMP